MKVLLTGATSSQIPSKKNEDASSFAGLLNKALTDGGHDVIWIEPSISCSKEYLAEFDAVVVGMAPPNSTSAYRIYGALSIAGYARELGTLRLMLDAPEPRKVWAGIRAISKKPEDLTKDFYSKRKEYRKALERKTFSRLNKEINALFSKKWPNTIYPSLPWMSSLSVSSEIPMINVSNARGLNYDSGILSNTSSLSSSIDFSDYWVVDSPSTKWVKEISNTLRYEITPMKENRWESSEQSLARLEGSIGCLVSVYQRGAPWWSSALSQALCQEVPVVTDWMLSMTLGADWSVLAQTVEDMSVEDRKALAITQRSSYLQVVPSWDDSIHLTCNALLGK